MNRFLTQQELCNELRVEKVTLWKLRKLGMPYIRLGKRLIRYDYNEVISWIDKFSISSSDLRI